MADHDRERIDEADAESKVRLNKRAIWLYAASLVMILHQVNCAFRCTPNSESSADDLALIDQRGRRLLPVCSAVSSVERTSLNAMAFSRGVRPSLTTCCR